MTDALCSINGAPCASGRAFIPDAGVWTFEGELVNPEPLAGKVVVKIGGLELRGTVDPARGGTFAGRQTITVVAGAGSWGKNLEPKHSQNDGGIQRSRLAVEAAAEVGEIIVVDAAADGPAGVIFEREAAPASQLLSLLFPASSWWVGTDGVTRVGARSTFEAKGVRVLDQAAGLQRFELAFEGTDVSQALPGAVISDPLRLSEALTVGDVVITYGRKLSAFATRRGARNALAEGIQALARAGDAARRYHGLYAYRVYDMAGDRARLQIVDKALTGLPDALPVDLVPGIAGASAVLQGGSICYVQFVNGDPAQPVVTHYERAQGPGHLPDVSRINASELVELAGGAQFIALANLVQARFKELATIITSAVPVSGDGGVGLQIDIKAKLQSVYDWSPTLEPPTVAAEKVKAT